MRYKPDHKKETHRRIVDEAAKEYRAHGFEGVGIAKLMGALKLTHGGFYAHFPDKEDLVAESLVLALDQSFAAMLAALNAGGFSAMLDYYLSEGHRDNSALGCPLPALAAEVARRAPSSREAFTKKLSDMSTEIAKRMPGHTQAHKLEKVNVTLAAMAGAVSLARAVSDPALSKTILRSTRDYLLHFIEESNG